MRFSLGFSFRRLKIAEPPSHAGPAAAAGRTEPMTAPQRGRDNGPTTAGGARLAADRCRAVSLVSTTISLQCCCAILLMYVVLAVSLPPRSARRPRLFHHAQALVCAGHKCGCCATLQNRSRRPAPPRGARPKMSTDDQQPGAHLVAAYSKSSKSKSPSSSSG